MSKEEKIRALFGAFPIWLELLDDGGCKITGFWSNIAIFVDENATFFCHFITFGLWDREAFAFFPYKENNCKYWIQALIKSIITPR